jgi:hypothetical protein
MTNLQLKKLNFLGSKTTIYPSLGLHKRISKLQKKPSTLKREHPALQNMKFLNFFLLLRVIFALLDLDSEYGSADLIESGSNTNLNPKRCQKAYLKTPRVVLSGEVMSISYSVTLAPPSFSGGLQVRCSDIACT